MYQKSLPLDEGMFFIFPSTDFHSIWMKDTFIPLDIIWITEDFQVTEIKENAQPCQNDPCPTLTPQHQARYVLELNANSANKINLKPGGYLEIK